MQHENTPREPGIWDSELARQALALLALSAQHLLPAGLCIGFGSHGDSVFSSRMELQSCGKQPKILIGSQDSRGRGLSLLLFGLTHSLFVGLRLAGKPNQLLCTAFHPAFSQSFSRTKLRHLAIISWSRTQSRDMPGSHRSLKLRERCDYSHLTLNERP